MLESSLHNHVRLSLLAAIHDLLLKLHRNIDDIYRYIDDI